MLMHMVERLAEFIWFIIVALIFSTVATMYNKRRTLLAFILAYAVAVPVGVIAGLATTDFGWCQSVGLAVTSGASLIAQDTIKFILSITGYLKDNSTSLLQTLIDVITERISQRKDND